MAERNRKVLWRFKWSHQSSIHRWVVQRLNSGMSLVPFSVKYGIGQLSRRNEPPYSLIRGKTVVQIGSPSDTLRAGRSRGMYFSLLAGPSGKVVVVEPDPTSVDAFQRALQQQKIANTTVHWSGAWSGPGQIELFVNRRHPATNFTGGTDVAYDDERMKEYERVIVQSNSVDNILAHLQISDVYLVSITTNWAEIEILEGMRGVIAAGLPYISLAYGNPGTDYIELMDGLGYRFYSHDDRGITFENKSFGAERTA